MVTTLEQEQPAIGKILLSILLVALALTLPGLHWSLFSWTFLTLPLLAFLVYCRFGMRVGKRMLMTAVVIALGVHLLMGSFKLFLFASVMLPPGYVLYHSAQRGASPAESGLLASLALAAGWVAAGLALTLGGETFIYRQMLEGLDQALLEALGQYRASGAMDAQTLALVEATIGRMQTIIPVILPGTLGSMALLIVWTTMALGKIAVEKVSSVVAWQDFSLWSLPEKLIWAAIGAGLSIMLPWPLLAKIGINAVLLLAVLYTFQGMSVTVFFMRKWNVPLLLRSFLYVMIIFQSLGTIALLCIGIADTWIDFRRQKGNAAPSST